MENLKPFSESINVEMEKFGAGIRAADALAKNVPSGTEEIADAIIKAKKGILTTPKAIEILEISKEGFFDPKINKFVPKDLFRKAQAIVTNEVKDLQGLQITGFHKFTPEEMSKKIKYYKNLLATSYPEAEAAKEAMLLAEKATKEAAQKIGIIASGKTLAKFVLKASKWIIGGMIVADVINRIKNEMQEEPVEKRSECNTIPHGDFYHKDVGWY